jgi:hypothetical protein
MKTLVAQTLKTVTLGTSSNYSSRSSIGAPTSNATQRDSNKMVRLVTPCGGVNSNELQTNQSFFNDGNLSPQSQTEHVEEKNNLCRRNIVDENLHHQVSKKIG